MLWAQTQRRCSSEKEGLDGTKPNLSLACFLANDASPWLQPCPAQHRHAEAASSPCKRPVPQTQPSQLRHRVVQAKGAGYAISRDEELKCVSDVALATGIVLDPV